MKVLGINRVEILVADPDAAQTTFTRLFNGAYFTPDASLHGRPIECRHDWQHGLEIIHPQTDEGALADKIKRYGEGYVVTIVYEVDSIDAAREHLLAQGFTVQFESDNSAHPDVEVYRQLLLKSDDTHGFAITFMERRWKAGAMRTVAPTDAAGLHMNRISGVQVVVRDVDAAATTFGRLFGGGEFIGVQSAANPSAAIRVNSFLGLELISPKNTEHIAAKVLAKEGEGSVVYVVFAVDDLPAAESYLRQQDFEFQHEFNASPRLLIDPAATHHCRIALTANV